MKKYLILFVVLFLGTFNAQTFKQVEIFINNPSDIQQLFQAGMEFDHPDFTKNSSFITVLSDKDFEILESTGFIYNIIIDDVQKYYESIPPLTDAEKQNFIDYSRNEFNVTGFGYGSMGGHYTFNEVIAELDSMFLLYPNLITQKVTIGTTVLGRPIYAVKISDNPNEIESEPRVLYTALHHAREPQGMMSVIYFMYYLLENYGTNPEATYIVNNRELFFIPVVNPDGYEHNRSTNPNGGGLWRKNRKNNGTSYGVDLNRNYGPYAYWNAPNGGSSTTPSSDTYRGVAPFSELETTAIRDFLAAKNIKCALNYHTYSNLLIYPYGALGTETPDSAIFREYARDMTQFNHYVYGTDLQTVNYSTRGNSDDYFYDGDTVLNGGKIFAMTPEVGASSDGFWAPQARIFPLAQENLYPNLYYAMAAGAKVDLVNPNFDRMYFSAGDLVSMQPVIKNKGLSASGEMTINLTSLSQHAVVTSGTVQVSGIPARTEMMLPQPFAFQISVNVPVEQKIKFLLTKMSGPTVISHDTVSIIIGVPTFTFLDSSNVLSAYWTSTGSPGTSPLWERTTTSFYSAPASYTDSRIGNYIANATVTLTSTNPISLSGMNYPKLSFWMKHNIEADWDCGVVLISTNNGTNWTALQGIYSRSASGSGKQVPVGMPCYDNLRSTWVKEEIDLAAYSGQNIKLRFELRSDGSIQEDGWYIDDIGIFYYGIVPVEMISFKANLTDQKVQLNWVTASELNNKGFEIERAAGNKDASVIKEWEKIGYISGKGTVTENSSYSYTDINPLQGRSYYRLKQIDFDGSVTYVNAVEVELQKVLLYSLGQNYPNPFNPSTTINFSIPSQEFVTLKIYNLLGAEKSVLLSEVKDGGEYSIEVDAGKLGLSSGVYFYSIKAGNYSQTRKMIILK